MNNKIINARTIFENAYIQFKEEILKECDINNISYTYENCVQYNIKKFTLSNISDEFIERFCKEHYSYNYDINITRNPSIYLNHNNYLSIFITRKDKRYHKDKIFVMVLLNVLPTDLLRKLKTFLI